VYLGHAAAGQPPASRARLPASTGAAGSTQGNKDVMVMPVGDLEVPSEEAPGWRGNCGEEQEFGREEAPKPWLGDLVLTPKPASAWFNDILIACKRLPQCWRREFREILGERHTGTRPCATYTNWEAASASHQGQAAAPGCRLEALVRFKR